MRVEKRKAKKEDKHTQHSLLPLLWVSQELGLLTSSMECSRAWGICELENIMRPPRPHLNKLNIVEGWGRLWITINVDSNITFRHCEWGNLTSRKNKNGNLTAFKAKRTFRLTIKLTHSTEVSAGVETLGLEINTCIKPSEFVGENKPYFRNRLWSLENKAENQPETEGIWNTEHSSPVALWNSSQAPLDFWKLVLGRHTTECSKENVWGPLLP